MVLIVKDSGYFHNPDPRVSDGLLALYKFDEGSGTTVNDSSGVGTPLNLTIGTPGNASWAGDGLDINASNQLASVGNATKINDAIDTSGELTMEAWITPANITQDGPARIISVAPSGGNGGSHNIMLGQGQWSGLDYDQLRVRTNTTTTNADGQPAFLADGVFTNTNQKHIVYVFRTDGSEEVWIDGTLFDSGSKTGSLTSWESAYNLYLANEDNSTRPWLGTFHIVAFYDKALSQAEIEQNYAAGPRGDVLPGPDETPPAAPTGLVATAGDASVTLAWNANSEPDFANYAVYRSTTSGSGYQRIASGLTSPAFVDTLAMNDTTYYYVVTARDDSANESAYSNEDSATPAANPGPGPGAQTLSYSTGSTLTESGSGLASILETSVPNYSDIQDGDEIVVFADHNSEFGVSYVEAQANAGAGVSSVLSRNGTTGYVGYRYTLDGASFPSDGWYTFRFKATPLVGGTAAVLERTYYVHKTTISYTHDLFVSPSGTGDGLTSGTPSNIFDALGTIAAGSADGVRLKLLAGDYTLPNCFTAGNEQVTDRYLTLERAPGVDLADCRIVGYSSSGAWIGEFLKRVNYNGLSCEWTQAPVADDHSNATDFHVFREGRFTHSVVGASNLNGTGKYPYNGLNGQPLEPGWNPFFHSSFGLNPHIIDCEWDTTRFGPINCTFVLGGSTHDTVSDIFRYPDFVGHHLVYDIDEDAYGNQAYAGLPGGTIWKWDDQAEEWVPNDLHCDVFEWSFDDNAIPEISSKFIGWHVEVRDAFAQHIFYKGSNTVAHRNHFYNHCSFSIPDPNPHPQSINFSCQIGDTANRTYTNFSFRHCAFPKNQFIIDGNPVISDLNFWGCYHTDAGTSLAAAAGGANNAFNTSSAATLGTNPTSVTPSWTSTWRPDSNFLDSLVPASSSLHDLDGALRGDSSDDTAAGAFRGSNETD